MNPLSVQSLQSMPQHRAIHHLPQDIPTHTDRITRMHPQQQPVKRRMMQPTQRHPQNPPADTTTGSPCSALSAAIAPHPATPHAGADKKRTDAETPATPAPETPSDAPCSVGTKHALNSWVIQRLRFFCSRRRTVGDLNLPRIGSYESRARLLQSVADNLAQTEKTLAILLRRLASLIRRA